MRHEHLAPIIQRPRAAVTFVDPATDVRLNPVAVHPGALAADPTPSTNLLAHDSQPPAGTASEASSRVERRKHKRMRLDDQAWKIRLLAPDLDALRAEARAKVRDLYIVWGPLFDRWIAEFEREGL